jgi:hypothetical protein
MRSARINMSQGMIIAIRMDTNTIRNVFICIISYSFMEYIGGSFSCSKASICP